MKRFLKAAVKILKWLILVLAAAIAFFLTVRLVGQNIYNRIPEGSINESLYVDINGTREFSNEK